MHKWLQDKRDNEKKCEIPRSKSIKEFKKEGFQVIAHLSEISSSVA